MEIALAKGKNLQDKREALKEKIQNREIAQTLKEFQRREEVILFGLSLKEIVEYGVIGILVLMSIIALWAVFERLLFYRYIKLVLYDNKTELEIELSKNLTLIATIGSNAPYVGLLGTVFGIIMTFVQIGQSGMVDTTSIMTGLALALQATAGGLLVAIPSIIFYNLLMRESEVLLAKWEILQEKKQSGHYSLKELEEKKGRK